MAAYQDDARHVDHEMVHILLLHSALEHPKRRISELCASAMRTAWAAHYRALMEFFHGKRKDDEPHPEAIRYCTFLDSGGDDPLGSWGHPEWMRVKHADSLLAHLGERDKHGSAKNREWGEPRDFRLIYPKIRHAMEHVTDAANLFPDTAEVLGEFPCHCISD